MTMKPQRRLTEADLGEVLDGFRRELNAEMGQKMALLLEAYHRRFVQHLGERVEHPWRWRWRRLRAAGARGVAWMRLQAALLRVLWGPWPGESKETEQ